MLSVPSPWVKERIETRYLEMVRAALADVGAAATELQHRDPTRHRREPPLTADPLDVLGFTERRRRPPRPAPRAAHGNGAHTNGATDRRSAAPGAVRRHAEPKYTFDAFVIGSSNRFAHAAALTVAERPGLAYNPLFVYGDAGLGKTHLLQAIGHYVHENYRGYRVRYVSSETFLNEFVDSIRTGVGDSFKRRYRGVDVLMVDDIQFFERGKETLEEFFHTFNALHESGRQIVLSSDRRPDDLPALEDRLRTRFKAGLVTDIQPPDLETRLAILRKKAESHPAQIPDAVLEYIATHITDNIRELEGALTRVSAYASLYNEPLSVESAERVLRDLLNDRQPRVITRRADPRRHVEDVRPVARRAAVEQPHPAAGQRPPDRDVRVPRADRPQLPPDRQGVRQERPHDGHPRRPEDREADGREAPDLRPGQRADPTDQERHMTSVETSGEFQWVNVGDNASSRWTTRQLSRGVRSGRLSIARRWGQPPGCSAAADQHERRVIHNPQALLPSPTESKDPESEQL